MSGLLERFRSWLFAEDVELPDYPDEEQGPDVLPRRRGKLIALPSRAGEIFVRRPQNRRRPPQGPRPPPGRRPPRQSRRCQRGGRDAHQGHRI